jgi:hypothetical protein
MNPSMFYEKLKKKQDNSQRWNEIVEDIIVLYDYHFLEKNFSKEELWDFMFTVREDHLVYHNKIWDCFNNSRYCSFFKLVYDAMDDPDRNWWNLQFKAVLY